MRDRVHYFSKYNMSGSFYWERAANVIYNYQAGWRPEDINDVVELYNIWLFVKNGVHDKTWKCGILETVFGFKEYVITAFRQLVKDSWASTYEQVDIEYRRYFWEIIDNFNISP